MFIHIHECPRKPVAVLSFLPARFLLAHRPNKRPGASPSWTETTCIGSSSLVHGGWDSLARRPLPVRSVLPPGSVLFCETQDPEPFTETVAAGGGVAHIGSRMESGFGLVAVGVWPDAAD